MTVTIELKPETEKRLAKKARKEGKPIKLYLEEFIEESVEKESEIPENKASGKSETKEEWIERFRRWLDSHKDKGYPSIPDEALRRENMYEDRI